MVEESQPLPPRGETASIPDQEKTQEQLISELVALRQRVAELETDLEQRQLSLPTFAESTPSPINAAEYLIAHITQAIRQSLELEQMLNTTVAEVQQFLQVDRVVVYRFLPQWQGEVVAESVRDPALSLLHRQINDPCFGETMAVPYQQGRIQRISDLTTTDLAPCYVDLLTELNVRAALVIPILVRQELWGLLIAHQCTSSRQWQELSWTVLQQLSAQLGIGIHQAELYQQTQRQAQQEQALNQVIQEIRNSLDLDTIFVTATQAIGQLLQLNRVEIVQYLPSQQLWLNVASYRRSAELPDATGLQIPAEENRFSAQLLRDEIVQVIDYRQEADWVNQAFVQDYAGSWLLVPLHAGETVWGSLSLNRNMQPGGWQEREVELARAVANQLSIALQQSQLYQAIQSLNNQLEQQVQNRTAQLEQALEFEALLKRITDRVRDSFDEQYILRTATEELSQGLNLLGCDTALYDLSQQTATVQQEHIRAELASALGRVASMADKPDLYTQLLQGQATQFCHAYSFHQPLDQPPQPLAILTCPMIDNREVVGDLWLFKSVDQSFDRLEIRLVQQVANQCAIALRQSRLFQAAHAQVQEWERLNRLKSTFLSTISHELRTPMSNIRMATQMLRLALFNEAQTPESPLTIHNPARLRQYFQILQDECQREIRLIEDLLDLSRLESEAEPLALSAIDLQTLIPQLAATFADRLQAQQQQLQIALPASLPVLTSDLRYLERILTELLTNACKYTPRGERIVVSAAVLDEAPAALLLQVTNYGVAIPEAEQERIFDTFYRIPSHDPWQYGGTGLGLALVKKLVERLQGQVGVESSHGQTSFWVRVPL